MIANRADTKPFCNVLWASLRLHFDSDDLADTIHLELAKWVVPPKRILGARYIPLISQCNYQQTCLDVSLARYKPTRALTSTRQTSAPPHPTVFVRNTVTTRSTPRFLALSVMRHDAQSWISHSPCRWGWAIRGQAERLDEESSNTRWVKCRSQIRTT